MGEEVRAGRGAGGTLADAMHAGAANPGFDRAADCRATWRRLRCAGGWRESSEGRGDEEQSRGEVKDGAGSWPTGQEEEEAEQEEEEAEQEEEEVEQEEEEAEQEAEESRMRGGGGGGGRVPTEAAGARPAQSRPASTSRPASGSAAR